MSRQYESTRTYDGLEVQVFAEEFDSGPGIPYGPTCIWATLDDHEFPLTQEQEDEIAIAASDWIEDDSFEN